MPYSGPDDKNLPSYVKKLSVKLRKQWIAVWTAAMAEYGDESRAFATANAAVKRSEGMDKTDIDEDGKLHEEETTAPEPQTPVAAAEAKPPSNPGGPAEINQNPNDENDEDEGWSAYCPKCKKKQEIIEAKEMTVGKRKGMRGTCKECKGKVDWFPDAPKESARYVSEGIDLREATLDNDAKTVELTIIKPGWSANNRYYDKNILKESVALFENCKAYADHPGRNADADRPERSIRDIVGYYPKVWLAETGAIKAQLKVLGEATGWLWPLIEETVRTGVDLVSTSINALGKVTEGEVEGRKGAIVNQIVKANSADVVTTAAAGGKFERILASDDGMTSDLLAAMGYDEWVQGRADYAVRLREELKTARKDEADVALREEIGTAKKTIEDGKAELTAVQAKLVEAQAASEAAVKELNEYKACGDTKIQEAVKAKDTEIAQLRNDLAAERSARLADRLLSEAKLPDGVDVREKILDKTEEEAKTIIEEARAGYRKLVLKEGAVPVSGNGPEKTPLTNPVASILGVDVVTLPGERPEEYAVRKRRVLESRGG
jgi:hypothetical protein